MQHPSSTEWPIWHDDPWHNPHRCAEFTPLRHDIALAAYLEKQQAYRISAVREFELWLALIRVFTLIGHAGHAFFRRLRPFQQIDDIGSTLAKAQSEFGRPFWGR